MIAWLFLPDVDDSPTIGSRAFADARGLALAAVTASMIIVALIIVSILGIGVLSSFSWPVVIGAAGLVLIWRNASTDEQDLMRTLALLLLAAGGVSGRSRWRLRAVVACVMLIAGLVTVATVKHAAQLLGPLGGVVLLIGAILRCWPLVAPGFSAVRRRTAGAGSGPRNEPKSPPGSMTRCCRPSR